MENLEKLARLIRYYCLLETDSAGSGHLTSSLSATDLMTVLFFGGFFHFDPKNPDFPNNDRIIFSKGHASPLFYALWAAAGQISEQELKTYRKFGSALEGHPSMEFPLTLAPTGSLGQGLSIGLGVSLAAKMDELSYKTYVLLGDGEMAEGQVWEALEIASKYKLNNLVGVIDVNRLGQSGPTMYEWDTKEYQKRISAFGWETLLVDGHDISEISRVFSLAHSATTPCMIIAKTVKGKGIKFLENKEGFHGKPLPHDKVGEALKDIGEIDKSIRGTIAKPKPELGKKYNPSPKPFTNIVRHDNNPLSTRKAYGQSLGPLLADFPGLVVLDAEVSNSTYSEIFKKVYPDRFLEMYIAEQNMVSASVGLSKRGKIPFVSTFSAFFTRAHDQLRMAAYARANIKLVGSHAGVSIGEDGASQMGLEDISMFRSLPGSTVLYPSDAVSTQKLVEQMAKNNGLMYLRTTRMETPIIYDSKEDFAIGGSKTLKFSRDDKVTIVAAGITLHEAIKAGEDLKKEKINVRVIDLYSIKPIDCATLERAGDETGLILVVEDHYKEGGIYEAVSSCLVSSNVKVFSLSVSKMPRSGKPEELLSYEEIDKNAIVNKVKEILNVTR